jgi:LDH2 family malate/lactate/ureidoglycolate dehydrogenase
MAGATERQRYDGKQLQEWVSAIFAGEGFSAEDAATIAGMLVYADLHGIQSHGIQRVKMYDDNMQFSKIDTSARPEVVFETPVSAVMDGHQAMGQLVGVAGTRVAIAKAQGSGVGLVSVRNSSHYGIAGYYASLAADAGLIGLSMTNSRPAAVPTWSQVPYLGTNPIALAVPAQPHPFLFDAATTTVPAGKVELYGKLGKSLPEGWAIDDQGEPTHDPAATLDGILNHDRGGLTPLGGGTETTGGHKGYGYAMLVELFTGILSQGNTSHEIMGTGKPVGICHSFIAIDPRIFGDTDAIIERFSAFLEELRALPAIEGHRVLVAGDKEAAAFDDRERRGIPVSDATIGELRSISERLGVSADRYASPLAGVQA